MLTHDGPCWVLFDSGGRELDRTESDDGVPRPRRPDPLRCVPVTWTPGSPFVELIGLDKDGAVYVSEFRVEDGRLDVSSVARVQDGADLPGGHPVRVRVQHGRRRVADADRLAQLEDRPVPAGPLAAEPEPLHGRRLLLLELTRGDPGGLRPMGRSHASTHPGGGGWPSADG